MCYSIYPSPTHPMGNQILCSVLKPKLKLIVMQYTGQGVSTPRRHIECNAHKNRTSSKLTQSSTFLSYSLRTQSTVKRDS